MFITIDGLDGSGKSSLVSALCRALRVAGYDPIQTREPGGSAGAEVIRNLLVTGEPDRWSPEVELLLFNAARRDHVERLIKPALAAGQLVICDRYVDSTRAYQGLKNDSLLQLANQLHDSAIGLDPDLTLILDVDPSVAHARSTESKGNELRFEGRGLAFQEGLREAFLQIAKEQPHRCRVVDASQEREDLLTEAFGLVRGVLESHQDDCHAVLSEG